MNRKKLSVELLVMAIAHDIAAGVRFFDPLTGDELRDPGVILSKILKGRHLEVDVAKVVPVTLH